jgi:hypothetical protein
LVAGFGFATGFSILEGFLTGFTGSGAGGSVAGSSSGGVLRSASGGGASSGFTLGPQAGAKHRHKASSKNSPNRERFIIGASLRCSNHNYSENPPLLQAFPLRSFKSRT